MKRTTLLGGVAALLLALTACGQVTDPGPQTSRQRTVDGVHAVDLRTSGDLTIQVGDTENLTVTAGSNVIDNLTSDVVDGTLVLDSAAGRSAGGPIAYTLTVRGLDRIEQSGSGNVTASGVPGGDATLVISGSGSATLSDLQLTTLSADLSGSGGGRLSGSTEEATVTVSGSGDFDGADLASVHTRVQVSGSGNARVHVTGQLEATASGSGDIVYTGNPSSVQRDSSGSGDITSG